MNGDEELPAGPRLLALAGELVRLQPSRTDPEAYFVSKDRIVTELRRLSRQVDWRSCSPTAKVILPRNPSNEVAKINTPSTTPIPTLGVSKTSPGIASLPRSPHCRHCRRRQAAQSRRHRLKLPDRDLFQWAEEHVL
jgi:hypothetical protein